MPGFKTHSIFGSISSEKLKSCSLKRDIEHQSACFQMGNQGPDFLFYYVPAHLLIKNNPGDILHTTKVSEMFRTLLSLRDNFKNEDLSIVDSYIAGFFGHYILDSKMHPYIYFRTNHLNHLGEATYDFGNHSYLETDIDQACTRHFFHQTALEYKPWEKIDLSRKERHVISNLMYQAISILFPKFYCTKHSIGRAMYFMRLEQRLMFDPSGKKKSLMRQIDNLTFKHAFISTLIPFNKGKFFDDPCNLRKKEWYNPWEIKIKSNESVYEMIEGASNYYISVLTAFNSLKSSSEYSTQELLNILGNKSYLTGLEL